MKLISSLLLILFAILSSACVVVPANGPNDSDARRSLIEPCASKPYVVCTHTLSTCREQRMSYDHCGNAHCYWVTVVTYQDVYNSGATRTYSTTSPG